MSGRPVPPCPPCGFVPEGIGQAMPGLTKHEREAAARNRAVLHVELDTRFPGVSIHHWFTENA